jgi:hypothetical protein
MASRYRRRMRLTHLLPTLLTLLALATPAAAEPLPSPWQPDPTTPFALPAGPYCTFELKVDILKDEGEVRVDARYPDDKVRINEYQGVLVAKFSGNGKSAVRDLSGRGWREFYPDGVTTKSFTGLGPFGARIQTSDKYPQGYYVFDGFTVITFDRDGTRHVPIHGPQENICQTLT